ncbi:hypothetical protein [Streptomyces sp. NPDC008150]|uniref:hypothetical protein n=1 Tax=Streptomyces sp. NPDC008150 TaxID=3364816 RepID=UPI0036E90CAE
MSYGRIERGPMAADNFTQISNALFRDPRLSAKAKGIFGFISTHRDGWGLTPESIAAAMRDGVSAVKAGLRELEAFGYLVRSQARRASGTMGPVVYRITDIPSSEPVDGFHPPAMTCENASRGVLEGSSRRSEPVDENPPAANPPAANHPHKKTSSNDTKGENTTSPSRPLLELVSPGAERQGGGGGNAPQQASPEGAAAAFVDQLPYRGRVPGPRQRNHLVSSVASALAAGWTEVALRAQLTSETDSAKSLAAVYRHRLDPSELPSAPQLPSPRSSEIKRGQCPECHRPLRNSAEDILCTDCREDASA